MNARLGFLLAFIGAAVVTVVLIVAGNATYAHFYPEIGTGLGVVFTGIFLILPLSSLAGALVGALG